METFGDLPPIEMKGDEDVDQKYYPHWKPAIDLNLVYDVTGYPRGSGSLPP